MRIVKNIQPSKNKVTIIGGVHGSELFGKIVCQYLEKNIHKYPGLCIILANEEALKKRNRYIDTDLNRAFPGSKKGNHEQMLAFELLRHIDVDSFIIDIHTTKNCKGIVPIITNASENTKRIIHHLNESNIVYMKNGFGSLISQFDGAVSLEFYEEQSSKLNYLHYVESIIQNVLNNNTHQKRKRNIYTCQERIPVITHVPKNAESFVKISGSDIIPFLPRNRAYNGYKGFRLSEPDEIMI